MLSATLGRVDGDPWLIASLKTAFHRTRPSALHRSVFDQGVRSYVIMVWDELVTDTNTNLHHPYADGGGGMVATEPVWMVIDESGLVD